MLSKFFLQHSMLISIMSVFINLIEINAWVFPQCYPGGIRIMAAQTLTPALADGQWLPGSRYPMRSWCHFKSSLPLFKTLPKPISPCIQEEHMVTKQKGRASQSYPVSFSAHERKLPCVGQSSLCQPREAPQIVQFSTKHPYVPVIFISVQFSCA